MTDTQQIREVADQFKLVARKEFTQQELLDIDAKKDGESIADICDANMLMAEALENLQIPIWNSDPEEGMIQSTVDLWNAAWKLAEEEGFANPQ